MGKESIVIDHYFGRTRCDDVNYGLLHRLRGLSCLVLMVLLGGLHVNQALAQVDQGAISGVVEDSSGAIVVGARVTLTEADTGLTHETTSNKSGIYTFSPIKIGKYSVSAAAVGFKTTVQENLQVNIQDRLSVPLVLSPGAADVTVTVTNQLPVLQAESGEVGQVITAQAIVDTPLLNRNWVYMAQLTPGVVPSPGTRGGAAGDYEANGQRAEQNNYVLDGVDNNINVVDYMNGSMYAVTPPPDAVSEFKIQTADFSAELGHSAGSALNISIKSGTNQIHGDVWEYVRNTALNAKSWNALTIPPYHLNQFGGTLGLPVLKNRLFYFGDIQATRIVSAVTTTFNTPTPLMRQGNFTELLNPTLTGGSKATCLFVPNSGGAGSSTATGCTGKNVLINNSGQQNVYNPSQINAVAQNILKLYPLPNVAGWNSSNNSNTSTVAGQTFNNITENLSTRKMTVQWDQRLDWNISRNDQAYARYSYSHQYNQLTPPLGPILDGTTNFAGTREAYLSQGFMLSETHIFNPRLINEFRFGYNWNKSQNLQANYDKNVSATLGMNNMPFGPGYFDNGGVVPTSVTGIQGFGSHGNDPSVEGQNVYQILDNVTKVIGNHSIKAGFGLQNFRVLFVQPPNSRGAYNFTGAYTGTPGASNTGYGVADFLADQMGSASITNDQYLWDEWRYDSAYVEDHWKVNPKLTLTYGLRYDYYQPYREMAGQMANFLPTSFGVGTGAATYQIPTQSSNVSISTIFTGLLTQDNIKLQYNPDPRLSTGQKSNFAPRLGFAYQIDPKTVIRSGFGIFYSAIQGAGAAPNISRNYPFLVQPGLNGIGCSAGNHCPSLGPDANGNPGAGQNYTGNPNATLENGLAGPLAQGLINFVTLPAINGRDAVIQTPYTMNYNLTLQHAFTNSMSATIGYVGNVSRHLETLISSNPAMALVASGLNTQFVQPFPQFTNSNFNTYAGASNYNSLQTTLERHFSNGMSFLSSYTWSHAMDNSVDPLGGGTGYRNTGLIPIADEYTLSNYDIRNRFTFNGTYQLPFGIGRQFLNRSRITDLVVGGWAGNLTFVAESGIPFTVGTSNITTPAGGSTHAIRISDPFAPGGTLPASNPSVTCAAQTKTKAHWYNPCAFANPMGNNAVPGTDNIPNTGNTLATATLVTGTANAISYLGGKSNVIPGPGYERINLGLNKNFTTIREQYVQFRADAFNLFNHPTWSAAPNVTTNNTNGGLVNAPLQLYDNTTPDARVFQLSAKYVF